MLYRHKYNLLVAYLPTIFCRVNMIHKIALTLKLTLSSVYNKLKKFNIAQQKKYSVLLFENKFRICPVRS